MLLQHILILRRLVHAEVREQFATLGDHAEETAAGRVILLVFVEVLGEQIDLLGENRDLHLRGSRVLLVGAVLLDQLFLGGALERHTRGGDRTKKVGAMRRRRQSAFQSRDRRPLYFFASGKQGWGYGDLSKKPQKQIRVDIRPPFDYAQGKPVIYCYHDVL